MVGWGPGRLGTGLPPSVRRPSASTPAHLGKPATWSASLPGSAGSCSTGRSSARCERSRSPSITWRRHDRIARPHSALADHPPAPETLLPTDQRPVMHQHAKRTRLIAPLDLDTICNRRRTSQRNLYNPVCLYPLKPMVLDRPNRVYCADLAFAPVKSGFCRWSRSRTGRREGFCAGGSAT